MSLGIAVIVVGNTWRVLCGKASDAELIQIVESEDIESAEEAEADAVAPEIARQKHRDSRGRH